MNDKLDFTGRQRYFRAETNKETNLLIEMLIGFETCCSVFVLIDEIESRSNGDDQRRLAARIICSMISDGFGSLASVEISFSVVMELVTGVNLGI